jgi:hypothetical protein
MGCILPGWGSGSSWAVVIDGFDAGLSYFGWIAKLDVSY